MVALKREIFQFVRWISTRIALSYRRIVLRIYIWGSTGGTSSMHPALALQLLISVKEIAHTFLRYNLFRGEFHPAGERWSSDSERAQPKTWKEAT